LALIVSIFSIFDPSSSLLFSLNWLSCLLGVVVLPLFYWIMIGRWGGFLIVLIEGLLKEFKVLLGSGVKSSCNLIFISLLMYIFFNNFLGLVPYVFTCSSHLIITLGLALPLWLAFMVYGWVNNTFHMLAHLVPVGTPGALMSFIVCIETIRNVIRPGTLAVRLAANIIAGHLLIVILSNQGVNVFLGLVVIVSLVQCLLLLLELAVAFIQSYVFSVLSCLYAGEVI
jgi:ATP synthase subunit 6